MTQDQGLNKSRRMLLLLAGLLAGIALYLTDKRPVGLNKDMALALIAALFYGAHTLLLTAHAGSLRGAVIWSFGAFAGVFLLGFQYLTHIGYGEGLTQWNDAEADFFVSLHFAFFLFTVYLQTWREEQGLLYPALFANACRNLVLAVLPFTLVMLVFLALGMISELFKVIGIDLLSRLLDKSWFYFPLGGLLFGLSVLYLRENEKTMAAAVRFSLAMFRIVGMLIGGAALIFLLCLPFVGLEPLWNSRMAASMLLAVVVVTGFHANAYIEDGSAATWGSVGKARQVLVTASIAVLPIYIGLAACAFWLRIDQHGLSPDRVYALPILVLSGGFALGYLYQIVTKQLDWVRHAGRVNIPMTILAAFVAVVMQLAPVSAYRIAADSQVARLQAGKVAPDDFDYGALKFSMAKPGRERFDTLLADDATLANLGFTRSLADLRELDSPHLARAVDSLRPIRPEDLRILPQGVDMAEAFDAGLLAALSGVDIDCADRQVGMPVCTLWAVDMNEDGKREYIWITAREFDLQLEVYEMGELAGSWRRYWGGSMSSSFYGDFLKAIEDGNFSFFQPRLPALMVNGTAFQFPLEGEDVTDEARESRK